MTFTAGLPAGTHRIYRQRAPGLGDNGADFGGAHRESTGDAQAPARKGMVQMSALTAPNVTVDKTLIHRFTEAVAGHAR